MKSPYLLLLPTVIVLVIVFIYPTIYLLYLSLCNFFLNKPWLGITFAGLYNYESILLDPAFGFWNSLVVTCTFTFISVSLEFLIGLGLALALSQPIRGRSIIRSCLLVPMVIPPVVVGLIWMFMFYTDYGIVNQFLKWIGIGGLRWLSDYSLSLLSLIIVDIWEWTPFMFLILLAALTSLPLEPYEAAEIDGASRWQTFLYVTLPMLRMPILTALLLRTIDAFKVFDIVYIMTSGGPGSSTMTLSMNTFIIAFRRFDIGKASALAFIIVAIVTVISQLYIKIIYKGEKR